MHNGAMQRLGTHGQKTLEERSGLRRLLRFQSLTDELESTPVDHQIIRPMGGQELRHAETQIRYVKNGQNPQMAYTQVHYLKGFFLLHHLCTIVGTEAFFRFLRHYIHDLYHGKLVHSTDFLTLYFETFKNGNTIQDNVEKICRQWLDTATLPDSVRIANEPFKETMMVIQVQKAAESWMNSLTSTKSNKKRKYSHSTEDNVGIQNFCPEQLLMFLELLIRCPHKLDYNNTLKNLAAQIGSFDRYNADIQHRLCELLVLASTNSVKNHSFLKQFLSEHQAMGVYIYSEMALSRNKALKKLALTIFEELAPELDPSTKHNISELLS